MSNHVILENEALYRRTRLMQEAEHHRLLQVAAPGQERPVRSYRRAVWRLGSLLVVLGERLQPQPDCSADCTGEVSFNF